MGAGAQGKFNPAQAGGFIDPAAGQVSRPLDNNPAYQGAQQRTAGIAQNMVGQEVAAGTEDGPGVPGGLPGGDAVEKLVAQVIKAVLDEPSFLEKIKANKERTNKEAESGAQ
jgi:hypothetical protein